MSSGRIDALAERTLDGWGRVGLVVGTIARGETTVRGYGRVRIEHEELPRHDTIFEIGSITKIFTVLALVDMVEDGLLSLDDPVDDHLPSALRVPAHEGRRITLRDLATHTSAFPRAPRGIARQALRERRNPYAKFSLDDLATGLRQTKLKRSPGAKFGYSNLGGGLLGLALAERTGTTYEELIRDRVCAPLGLDDTAIAVPAEKRARLAQGHTRLRRPVPPFEIPVLAGAGALRSTADDMLRFLQAGLGEGDTRLPRELVAMQGPRVRVGRRIAAGLGWMLEPLGGTGHRIAWHNGGTIGFRSFAGLVRETGTAVIVLSNTGRSVDLLGLRILEELDRSASRGL